MTGEATTGSRLNRKESPSPSLLNTVYSEAGWFGVIFPVISQTITPLGCDALQSSAQILIALRISSLCDVITFLEGHSTTCLDEHRSKTSISRSLCVQSSQVSKVD